MPAAAYRASIPPPSGRSIGVSGGGGEPLFARVVEVEAVDKYRFIVFGAGAARLELPAELPLGLGASGTGAA